MQDVITYIQKFASNLPEINNFIMIASAVVGLYAVIFALINQTTRGRRGEKPLAGTIAGLLIGSLMFSLPTVVNIFSFSMFGSASDPQFINSFQSETGTNLRKALQALVAIITVIGWIAVARGLWRWRIGPDSGQAGWFGQGLTLVIAGVLCINFYVFTDAIAASLGAASVGSNYFKYNF